MFLTRLGFDSKMVVTGDITQVDLPREQDSGLIVVSDDPERVEGIEFIRFGDEDVVRHKLVRRIVAAYNEHAQRVGAGTAPADGLRRAAVLDVEVIGIEVALERAADRRRARGAVRAGAVLGGDRGGARRDRVRRRGPEPRAQPRAPPDRRATDVLSFGVDEDGVSAGPRELGDIVICPPTHRGPARGGRPRCVSPERHGSRDRRRRDAGPPGELMRRLMPAAG